VSYTFVHKGNPNVPLEIHWHRLDELHRYRQRGAVLPFILPGTLAPKVFVSRDWVCQAAVTAPGTELWGLSEELLNAGRQQADPDGPAAGAAFPLPSASTVQLLDLQTGDDRGGPAKNHQRVVPAGQFQATFSFRETSASIW
jgi:hypothetical protein